MTRNPEGTGGGPGGGSTPAFEVRDVRFTYPDADVPAVEGVDVRLSAGRITGILGPNGSGKSTLLRLLLGVLSPDRGEIFHLGRSVRSYPRRAFAQAVGVVPQMEDLPFPLSVRDYVGMGRYPHLGVWQAEGARDRDAVHRAMERCGVGRLESRSMAALSGGERQRVRIARALAQEPRTLVLDEPTASLDIRYEMSIFELLADLAGGDGVSVILVTHHLNLAARYADELLLLHRGRLVRHGSPSEVVDGPLLEEVYGWDLRVVPHPGPGRDLGAPQVIPLAGPGDGRLRSPTHPPHPGTPPAPR